MTKDPTQGDGRLPSSADFDHLIYVRIFEGCNLHCQHCFIPSNPKRMSDQDIREIPEHIRNRIPAGSAILIQWHGGELPSWVPISSATEFTPFEKLARTTNGVLASRPTS